MDGSKSQGGFLIPTMPVVPINVRRQKWISLFAHFWVFEPTVWTNRTFGEILTFNNPHTTHTNKLHKVHWSKNYSLKQTGMDGSKSQGGFLIPTMRVVPISAPKKVDYL